MYILPVLPDFPLKKTERTGRKSQESTMREKPHAIFLIILALLFASLACSSQAAPITTPTPSETVLTADTQPPASDTPPPSQTPVQPTATHTAQPESTLASSPTPTIEVIPTQTASATLEPPTAAPTDPPLDRTLSLQSPRLQGDDVLLMQQRLVALGYSEVGEPDGIFGGMTESAVIRFQGDAGLTADGVVGPITWAALWGADPGEPVAEGPTPTSEYATSRILHAPNFPVKHISAKDEAIWVITPGDTLSRLDPATGKRLAKYAIGCQVCFGACEMLAAAREGDQFWALQYGSIQEQDCNADNPWEHVGFMLRKMKPDDESSSQVIDVSKYLDYASNPGEASLAAQDGKVWLGVDTVILVIDAGESDEENLVTLRQSIQGSRCALCCLPMGRCGLLAKRW
jgi:hypothetical protein